MKSKLKYMCIIVLLLIISLIFSGCGKNNSSNKLNLKNKINTEISYIDGELIYIANYLNNIDYTRYKVVTREESESNNSDSKNNENSDNSSSKGSNEQGGSEQGSGAKEDSKSEGSQESESKTTNSEETKKIFSMKSNNVLGKENSNIDWDILKNKIENLYTSWTTVHIDLKEAGVKEEKLDEFNMVMDNLAIAIKEENKASTLDNVIKLYSFLPEFMEQYNEDDKGKNLLFTKYNLLVCYKNVEEENWEELNNSISKLKMSFSNVYNKANEYKEKVVNINSARTIINEMSNSKEIKDKDIFLVKYKNLIQELNSIM